MKIKFLIAAVLSSFIFNTYLQAQQISDQERNVIQMRQLNAHLCKGWNTWNTNSVLSHVLLPEGFAINVQLVNHQKGDTLKEALIGREDYGTKEHVVPGPHCYDGSYTDLTVEWQHINVRVQSAAEKNDLFLLITPVNFSNMDSLIIDPQMLWGRKGKIKMSDGIIIANTPSGEIRIKVAGGNYSTSDTRIIFSLDHDIALSTDKSKSAADIESIMKVSEKKFTAEKSKYKEASEEYNAMQTVLAWNTVYDPANNRLLTPVSRNWCVGWQGWVLFEWDNYFAAYMLSLDNKDLAYSNAIAITKEITKRGFVPNFGSSKNKSEDRSEPPVGSLIVNEIYKKYHEKWFLKEVFDELLSWNRWWANNRDINGYLCWGSDPYVYGKISPFLIKGIGTKKGAQWESGLDNSPMWDDAVFDSTRHRLMQADVGLMSLYITDCQSLSEIANALGKTAIVKELTQRADKYSKKLRTLWDDQFGLYLNKNLITGKFSYRLSPTLFYPLLVKVPTHKQAERMIKEHFYNPQEFWGQFIMPSITRNDPAFKDNKYWRGRIWAPMDFLVYLGMRNYQLPNARKDMVEKSKNLLLKSWLGEHHIYENYNATSGEGNDSGMSDPFYHWGALLGFIDIMDKGYVPAPELPLEAKN
ncbi:MGH1-like glycoside hydrolase domain-containing protein [Ginsengibacter hankyongi]|nr:trehalase family glycosidase [Ginsengibacter hankyongi]